MEWAYKEREQNCERNDSAALKDAHSDAWLYAIGRREDSQFEETEHRVHNEGQRGENVDHHNSDRNLQYLGRNKHFKKEGNKIAHH